MKYFHKKEDPKVPYQVFEFQKYEIPLEEIMLLKKHRTESVVYALYREEEMVYLLTNVSVLDHCIEGYGAYARPYCPADQVDSFSLATLDKDAYNWFMTHAR